MLDLGRRAFLILSLIAAGHAANAALTPRTPTFQCDYTIRTPTYGVVEKATLTTKGKLVKYQRGTGAGLKLMFLRNRKGTYHINVHTNDGARWPKMWEKDFDNRLMTPGPQGDPMAFLKGVHAKRTGQERVNGQRAEVWSYKLPTLRGEPQRVHVFLDPQTKRPLKAEARTQVAANQYETVVIQYKTYRWDFPLSDSYFDLPRGAKIADLTRVDPKLFTAGPMQTIKTP
jgi:hypothetical protein